MELISNLIGCGMYGCLVSIGICTIVGHFSGFWSLVQQPVSYNMKSFEFCIADANLLSLHIMYVIMDLRMFELYTEDHLA